MTLTTTRPVTQPTANAGPLERAFGVPSMRITAMIGTGLSATPTADGRMSPIAGPMVPSMAGAGGVADIGGADPTG